MSTPPKFRYARLTALCATLGFASLASAQTTSVTTTPVGAITVTVGAAPSVTAPRYTSISLPLLNDPIYVGQLTAVTANTITVAQEVSISINESNPCFIKITSGLNQGLTIPINSNAGSVLTLDNSRVGSLISLQSPLLVGTNGDSYKIYPADTLYSLFGNTPQGSPTANGADQVWLWLPAAGTYAKFYYNSTNDRWQDTDFDDPANNVVVMPDAGLMYVRRATTPIVFTITGNVPTCDGKTQIRNSGYTFISTSFPIPIALSNIGLNGNTNWTKSPSFNTADQVWIWQPTSGSYSKYFYNSASSQWEDSDFGDPSGSVAINPETPVMIKRFATGQTTYTTYTTFKPYTL